MDYDKEIEQLESDFEEGLITYNEYRYDLRELNDHYRDHYKDVNDYQISEY